MFTFSLVVLIGLTLIVKGALELRTLKNSNAFFSPY